MAGYSSGLAVRNFGMPGLSGGRCIHVAGNGETAPHREQGSVARRTVDFMQQLMT